LVILLELSNKTKKSEPAYTVCISFFLFLQIVEQRKTYVEQKDKEIKVLEQSKADLEVDVCELEKKVSLSHLLFC
jgi:peptidoglycan hydrolase CwlO-like protein